jgi:hypothetical protein
MAVPPIHRDGWRSSLANLFAAGDSVSPWTTIEKTATE